MLQKKMCHTRRDMEDIDARLLFKPLSKSNGETLYDAVSDVVESGVHWRSDFQIGFRVLKICFKPILMHIYGMQYDFMHRSC